MSHSPAVAAFVGNLAPLDPKTEKQNINLKDQLRFIKFSLPAEIHRKQLTVFNF